MVNLVPSLSSSLTGRESLYHRISGWGNPDAVQVSVRLLYSGLDVFSGLTMNSGALSNLITDVEEEEGEDEEMRGDRRDK